MFKASSPYKIYKYKKISDAFKKIKKEINYKKYILYFVLFMYGFVSSYFFDHHTNSKIENVLYEKNTFDGTIIDVVFKNDKYTLTIYLTDYGEKIETYCDLSIIDKILPGYKIRLEGIIKNIDDVSNLGAYNEKEYKKNKKIFYNFSGDIVEIKKGYIFILSNLYDLKFRINKIYDSLLDEQDSSILKAMILGESSSLDSDIKTLYKNGGIIHILAISGMHVAIIAEVLKKLLGKIIKNKKAKTIVLILTIGIYVILTGCNISTLRALIMMSFSELAQLMGRDYDSLSGLCFAAILLLVINPKNLFNLSFILSFASIISLKLSLKLNGPLKKFSSDISVYVLMIPILSYNFYQFQGLSIFANILILPLTKILVILSFLIILVNDLNYNLAMIFSRIVSLILLYYENVLTYLSKLTGFNILVGKMNLIQVVLWYSIYILLYLNCKNKNLFISNKRRSLKRICVIFIMILVLIKNFLSSDNDVLVTFIDVEHGDSSLIYDEKENIKILIDGGGLHDAPKDTGTYNVYPYLKYLGIDELDVAIVSHADRDHIKGVIELVDLVTIHNVIVPYGECDAKLYDELIGKCKEKDIPIKKVKKGDTIDVGELKLEVLNPDENKNELSENNNSIVIDMNVFDHHILFTGDIEKESEEIILRDGLIDSNFFIMKIPHHGSDTSSTSSFVKMVNPKYAVLGIPGAIQEYYYDINENELLITAGKDGKAIEKFKKNNIYKYKKATLLDTNYFGMITFRFGGD